MIAYEKRVGCAVYDPSDYRYNGRLVQVDVTHWRSPNTQVNGQSMVYEHIQPSEIVGASSSTAPWQKWNNAYAQTKFWAPWIEQYTFNNDTAGGAYIGYVTERYQSGENSCSNGAHLHQESGGGEYVRSNHWYMSVGDRSSDAAFVHMSGISGTAPTDR